jgi:uncharacterized protein DUF3291
MTVPAWHLAQLNVGRLRAPLESPEIDGFRAALGAINALADADPALVWRLQTEAGNATDIRPTDDDLFLINLSVWRSIEALRAFTYASDHVQVLRQRRSWFEQLAAAHMVLWWIPASHIPTIDEALDRLERLRRDGPTADAFNFRMPFAQEGGARGEGLVDADSPWRLAT